MSWTKIIIMALVAYVVYITFIRREGFGDTQDIGAVFTIIIIILMVLLVAGAWGYIMSGRL